MFQRILLMVVALACAAPVSRAQTNDSQPRVGERPPAVLGVDQHGQPVNLDALRGKVVVVTFWASWCGYCRQELPLLAHVQQVVGRDHLVVIAINYKESRRDFLSVIRANKRIDLTYVQDTPGTVSKLYGVDSLPHMFIIDTDGKLAHRHLGYDEGTADSFVQEMLELLPADVLQKPAAAS